MTSIGILKLTNDRIVTENITVTIKADISFIRLIGDIKHYCTIRAEINFSAHQAPHPVHRPQLRGGRLRSRCERSFRSCRSLRALHSRGPQVLRLRGFGPHLPKHYNQLENYPALSAAPSCAPAH